MLIQRGYDRVSLEWDNAEHSWCCISHVCSFSLWSVSFLLLQSCFKFLFVGNKKILLLSYEDVYFFLTGFAQGSANTSGFFLQFCLSVLPVSSSGRYILSGTDSIVDCIKIPAKKRYWCAVCDPLFQNWSLCTD